MYWNRKCKAHLREISSEGKNGGIHLGIRINRYFNQPALTNVWETGDSENKLQFQGVFKPQFGDEAVQVKIILCTERLHWLQKSLYFIYCYTLTCVIQADFMDLLFSLKLLHQITTAEVIQAWNIIGIFMKNITSNQYCLISTILQQNIANSIET